MTTRAHDAMAVLRRFVEANAHQDVPAMMGCLSRGTLESGGFSGPMPGAFRFEFGDAESQGEQIIIPMTVLAPGESPDTPPTPVMSMRCIMVQEDGDWKFDLASTMQPQMEAMESAMMEAMQQVGSAMGEAMGAMGEALGGVLGSEAEAEVSPFTGEPLVFSGWDDAPGEYEADELRQLPEMTHLEITTRDVSDALGRDVPVVADVQSLMDLFGETDPTKLMPWLDGEFTAGLGQAIALSPFADRLRRVRIEASLEWRCREMLLDGTELVYRADLRADEGWYRFRDELLTVIPPVLAALMAPEPEVPEGFTTLPTQAWGVTVTQFRERLAPRLMRRISTLAGGPVALDVPWGSMINEDTDGKRLQAWGLFPVLAALATLASTGEGLAPGALRVIRLEDSLCDRRASFAGGVLHLEMLLRQGEQGCFRPHELVGVLKGTAIEPTTASGDEPAADGQSAQ
ncbi:MAG: hypothetical protein DYG92_11565 [Leptolyngbya sp. PLA1]|nr:hypothetical protein [Leptolyngbya sp. PLA1]